MKIETQETVVEWCEEHYPNESILKKFINLIEEVAELGCVLGASEEIMSRVINLTVAKSDDPVGDDACTRKEIGDVQLSIFNLAASLKADALKELNAVMAQNRERTKEESQARRVRKEKMGIKD